MAEKPDLVHVEIFGQSYSVRAGTERGYVEQLAAHVDAQMRDVSRTSGVVDTLRIAVLAALNIADECFELRSRSSGNEDRQNRRAAALARELASAMDE